MMQHGHTVYAPAKQAAHIFLSFQSASSVPFNRPCNKICNSKHWKRFLAVACNEICTIVGWMPELLADHDPRNIKYIVTRTFFNKVAAVVVLKLHIAADIQKLIRIRTCVCSSLIICSIMIGQRILRTR